MKALLLGCLLSSRAASAESYLAEPDEPAAFDRMLGMRIGFGSQTFHDRELTMMSIELGVEHRVASQLRIAAEYEYVWLGLRDTEPKNQSVTDGGGHRGSLILRHHLARTRTFAEVLRFYLDLEVGGGFFLGSEPMTGTIAKAHALAGIRVGYDFIRLRSETRASKIWEPELTFRLLAMPGEPLGMLVGVGMGFGD